VTIAYVGIGSNLGSPRAQVQSAFVGLAKLPQTALLQKSSLYGSAPVGYPNQPDFVNAVAELDTALSLEARHGRERSFRNAPRTLDVDLLLFGDLRQATPTLEVPHPRMHERAFVLAPLLEIAPGVSIPGKGPAARLLAACEGQRVERLA
jgi:2-amino-4-hydroxy-6-hydroxymethyldihydropteridine diphosphokinase